MKEIIQIALMIRPHLPLRLPEVDLLAGFDSVSGFACEKILSKRSKRKDEDLFRSSLG